MRALMLALGANAFHQATLVALVPVLQAIYGVSLDVLGMLVGFGLLVAAASVPLWGRAAAVAGLRSATAAALICAAAGVVLMGSSLFAVNCGLVDDTAAFALLVIGRLVFSLSAPALLPLTQSADGFQGVQQSGGGEAGAGTLMGHIGRANAMSGLGRLAGNALVAPLLALGLWVPIVFPLLVYLAALTALLRQRAPAGIHLKRALPVEAEASVTAEGRASGPGWRSLGNPLAFGFILQFAAGAAYILLGPLIAGRLEFEAKEAASAAGLCLAVAVAAGLTVQLGLDRLVGPRLQIGRLGGAALSAAGLGILSAADSLPVLALAASLLGAGVAAALGANTAFTIGLGREESRGAADSAIAATRLSSVQFAGLAVGAFTGGALGVANLDAALSVLAAVTAMAALPVAAASLVGRKQRTVSKLSNPVPRDPTPPPTVVSQGASE